MGSLSSSPKNTGASQPQTVIVQQAPITETTTDTSSDIDDAQSASEVRENNLLRRNRGRFGTIQTGFRGLLSLGNTSDSRRTLLGE